MAKLFFYYSTMNAGKSTVLLQANHNYLERGMTTLLLTPSIDNRFENGYVHSRIGLKAKATTFDKNTDLYAIAQHQQKTAHVDCILLDEAQFLTKKQVYELTEIVDELKIPVLAYGIRLDSNGETFEGSHYLLAWADNLSEIKTICHCGSKANHVVKFDEQGNVMRGGDQVDIGGNEKYLSMCRKHFKALYYEKEVETSSSLQGMSS